MLSIKVWVLKLDRAGDSPLQLLDFNEEFLVSVSHQLALITSLPFVHTAVGSSHPGAGAGPKGSAVRRLKRYVSWV